MASKIRWLTDQPVWVDQWPLIQKRLEIAQQLVSEKLEARHIEESLRPWNIPIFVIKKKQSGHWRLLQDLCKVNTIMVTMGAPQPRLPSPTMIPQKHSLLLV